jgi:ParB-like chromosome segregation protein Spo0J
MPHNIIEALVPLAMQIDQLHLDPANARKHNPKNLDAIKSSLAKFGQRKPIVVQREGMIVRAGNGTLQAAKALGWDHIAAVIVTEDNSSAAQFAIADNRTAELAEWDDDVLAALLEEMNDKQHADLGFDAEELREIMERAGRFDVDEVDAPALADGDKEPFQQMAFVLHDEQAEVIKRALEASKELGPFVDTHNENANGNALARIAEVFLGQC